MVRFVKWKSLRRKFAVLMAKRCPMVVKLIAGVTAILFTLVTAYVYKFGRPRSGIYPDYIVFSILTVILLKLSGVI